VTPPRDGYRVGIGRCAKCGAHSAELFTDGKGAYFWLGRDADCGHPQPRPSVTSGRVREALRQQDDKNSPIGRFSRRFACGTTLPSCTRYVLWRRAIARRQARSTAGAERLADF